MLGLRKLGSAMSFVIWIETEILTNLSLEYVSDHVFENVLYEKNNTAFF